jgi:alanine-glyoxylate transaminase/serine-glyoxylate transaminase/serine-pyruvate transaminase
VINHLGDTMAQIIEQAKLMTRYVFQTETGHILGVAGPGSAAMEMTVANLVVPGSKVLSVCRVFFSSRLAEMAERVRSNVLRLVLQEGQSADPEVVADYIARHQTQVLPIVQGETSSTVSKTDLAAIGAAEKAHNCLVIVDTVCTLSTTEFDMDEWVIDTVITGGQKGLSCILVVSLIGFSSKAWEHIQSCSDQLRHWCLDAKLADQFWCKKLIITLQLFQVY